MADADFLGIPMQLDSGWTASAGAGSKTTVVPNYTNGLNGTMVSALNVVSAGTGTALSSALDSVAALTSKVQALETALAPSKLPNS